MYTCFVTMSCIIYIYDIGNLVFLIPFFFLITHSSPESPLRLTIFFFLSSHSPFHRYCYYHYHYRYYYYSLLLLFIHSFIYLIIYLFIYLFVFLLFFFLFNFRSFFLQVITRRYIKRMYTEACRSARARMKISPSSRGV